MQCGFLPKIYFLGKVSSVPYLHISEITSFYLVTFVSLSYYVLSIKIGRPLEKSWFDVYRVINCLSKDIATQREPSECGPQSWTIRIAWKAGSYAESQDPSQTYRIEIFTSTRSRGDFYCWNNFLGPRWSYTCPGCSISNLELTSLVCPHKFPAWPEMQYIQSAKPQNPKLLQALRLLPVPSHPNHSWLCGPSQLDSFYFSLPHSLFFILYPTNISCPLPHFTMLWMETVCFMKCQIKLVYITQTVFFNH